VAFAGFGRGAQRFFADLAKHNDREWFAANRERYEAEVLEPAVAFVQDLGPRLAKLYPGIHDSPARNGTGSIMRIHRDVRFSTDKRPYKENLGVVFWLGTGRKVESPCLYLDVEARSAFFYAGQHRFPDPVLARYREDVAGTETGSGLVAILGRLAKKGLVVLEEPAWKRMPKGLPADHPRADLLRHDGLGVSRDLRAAQLAGPGLIETCLEVAAAARPLLDWLLAIND
jgi:uncharacterized protein (TIGR02453 family)